MPAVLQPALLERDRLGRRVLRSHLRLPSQDARFRATFALEEALRLAELPGESEGRVYFFQRVDLPAISAQASRAVWMERIQASLEIHAAPAVHGSHPSAASANAIYFHNLEEGLEILLGQSLRSNAESPWFAASVLGLADNTHLPVYSGSLVAAIVARLRPPAMPLVIASSIIVTALGTLSPSSLLDKLPEALLRDWLRDFEAPARAVPLIDSAVALPAAAENRIRQAAEHCGWRQPPTLWLAALVLIDTMPSLARSPDLLHRVRTTIRLLELVPRTPTTIRVLERVPRALASQDTDRPTDTTAAESSLTAPEPVNSDSSAALASQTVASERKTVRPSQATFSNETSASDQLTAPDAQYPKPAPELTPPSQTPPAYLLGEATQFAGLYFLLHVLRRLGIAAAVDVCPTLADAPLPIHILLQLAMRAGVSLSDPILSPLGPVDSAFSLDAETLAALPSAAFPNNLPLPKVPTDSRAFLRIWTHAVRRWCWVNTRISIGALILRPGRVWQTRADLDVTLPINAADTRIRRAGLDLDPLWLPWFGDYGRVVRFHYTHRTGLGETA